MNTKTFKTLKSLEKASGKQLTLGRFLWAFRKSEGLSQVELAEKLGLSKQYLCDLEHGRKIVSPKVAASFAEKLGFSSTQFIRLSLQDMLQKEGFSLKVELHPYSYAVAH